MDDVGVMMMVNLSVTDADTYRKYEKGFFPLLKKYQGSFMTFDDATQTFEGDDPIEGRVILFRFPSEEAAKSWYNDVEYQELSKFRRDGTKLRFLTMVKEMPPRG